MRAAVMQTLVVTENSNTDLKKKLTAEEQARKSAESALDNAEKQAESWRKLACEVNDQLAAAKEQLATLRKQLKETQRLRDQAEKVKAKAEEAKAKAEREKEETEQHGYDVDMAETEDALRAEVPAVCRAYCTQTWEEALNRAGIDASSELRKLENIFFLPTLQVPNQKEAAPLVSQLASQRGPTFESSLIQSAGARQRTWSSNGRLLGQSSWVSPAWGSFSKLWKGASFNYFARGRGF